MQSGRKSPALLFHDMAEMLIFKGRRVSWCSMNKMEVISQLQAELELSCTNVGNREERLPICGIRHQGQGASGMSIMQRPLLSLQAGAADTARGAGML